MDPQATLAAILAAIDANDSEAFTEAFESLHSWLARGGFAPVCQSLGLGKRNLAYGKTETIQRQTISCGLYALQTIAPDDFSRYEFVRYDHRGNAIARYPLAT